MTTTDYIIPTKFNTNHLNRQIFIDSLIFIKSSFLGNVSSRFFVISLNISYNLAWRQTNGFRQISSITYISQWNHITTWAFSNYEILCNHRKVQKTPKYMQTFMPIQVYFILQVRKQYLATIHHTKVSELIQN